MMLTKSRVSNILSIITLFFLFASKVSASVIFEDNFNSGDIGKWTVRRNQCGNPWEFKEGKVGIKINQNCVTEISPSDTYWNSSWNDYIFEVDIEFVSGTDRNIAWRYENPNDWVDIHFIGSNPKLQRLTLINSNNIQPTNNGSTFRFKIIANGNNHKIWYYNINSPENVSYMEAENPKGNFLTGRPALQASGGVGDPNSEVYFDNVKVTLLEEDEPEYLEVPHFSQRDELWKEIEYDHASTLHSPENDDIEEWGCALTSASMILAHNGYIYDAEGNTFTPVSLNNYLNQNHGYTKNAGVIWSGVSSFAEELQKSPTYTNQNLKSLEFQYHDYEEEILESILAKNQPAILRLVTNEADIETERDNGNHFVVAVGKGEDGFLIQDPLDLEKQITPLNEAYPDIRVDRIGEFIPSETDLSYIWIHQYNPEVNVLINHNEQSTGTDKLNTQFQDIPKSKIASEGELNKAPDFNTTFNPTQEGSQMITLQQPETGSYSISLSTTKTTYVDLEGWAYDQKGRLHYFTIRDLVYADADNIYRLTFDHDNSENTHLNQPIASFDRLRAAISYAQDKTFLNQIFEKQYLEYVNRAESFYPVKIFLSKLHLQNLSNRLQNTKNKWLMDEGESVIKDELNNLLNEL